MNTSSEKNNIIEEYISFDYKKYWRDAFPIITDFW